MESDIEPLMQNFTGKCLFFNLQDRSPFTWNILSSEKYLCEKVKKQAEKLVQQCEEVEELPIDPINPYTQMLLIDPTNPYIFESCCTNSDSNIVFTDIVAPMQKYDQSDSTEAHPTSKHRQCFFDVQFGIDSRATFSVFEWLWEKGYYIGQQCTKKRYTLSTKKLTKTAFDYSQRLDVLSFQIIDTHNTPSLAIQQLVETLYDWFWDKCMNSHRRPTDSFCFEDYSKKFYSSTERIMFSVYDHYTNKFTLHRNVSEQNLDKLFNEGVFVPIQGWKIRKKELKCI